MIGHWWDKKGENEIDMIAANELDKTVEICEIKRNRKNINFSILETKASVMLKAVNLFHGYDISYNGLDLNNM